MTAVSMLWGPATEKIDIIYSSMSGSAVALNSATNAAGNITALPKTGTISSVGFFISAKAGTPPAYKVSVTTVDTAGKPTRTDYGGSAPATYTPTSTGWKWVDLATPATATAGDIAVPHIYPGTSAPDGSNNISVLCGGGWSIGNSRTFTLGSWDFRADGAPIAVRYSDNFVWGHTSASLERSQSTSTNTSPDELGCKFTLPADMVCYGARVGMPTSGWNGGSLDVVLYDGSSNVLATGTIGDQDYSNTGTHVNVHWAGVSLTKETTYRIVYKPRSSIALDVPIFSLADTDAIKVWPQGDRWYATYRTDAGAWTDANTKICYMALWVNDITLSAAATGGGGEYAYIG